MVVEYLLSEGGGADTRTRDGETLLHHASRAGSVEIAEALIAKGARVDAGSDTGNTPLHCAARRGQRELVRLLIVNGADVNSLASERPGAPVYFPLGLAARYGHGDIVKLLLANGADVNLQAGGGLSALHAAAFSASCEIAELLLASGAKMIADAKGATPLHMAARWGDSKIVDILIAHGADVNADSGAGTPLHFAPLQFSAWEGMEEAVKRLFANGVAEINLQTAAFSRRSDNLSATMVQKLLAQGADVDAKHPMTDRTPLIQAIDTGRYRTAVALIAAGADVNATDKDGKTVLSVARETGLAETVELLLEHGAKE